MYLGCQFHSQRNVQGCVSGLDLRTPVARQIRGIFNASDAIDTQHLLSAALKDGQFRHLQLATWASTNLLADFNVFDLPEAHRVRMRTTHGLERLNNELKRRTRVATLFPNPDSCLRLIGALLAEQDEERMTAKIHLSMKPGAPQITKTQNQISEIYRKEVAFSGHGRVNAAVESFFSSLKTQRLSRKV